MLNLKSITSKGPPQKQESSLGDKTLDSIKKANIFQVTQNLNESIETNNKLPILKQTKLNHQLSEYNTM